MQPLRIAYLLEDTGLAGGIRVAAAQGDALVARGHDVTLATRGEPLTWRDSRARWTFVSDWKEIDATPFDFVVGTFWKNLHPAFEIAGRRAIHLCQGYEGSFTAYQSLKREIDAAYALPMPKITVSPHLVQICRRFTDDATYIGQIVDDIFFRQPQFRDDGRLRVLLVGPMQADFKGIDLGYEAVRHARSAGAQFKLVRVSQWPAADDEPADLASEFHVGLHSAAMARLIASCDVFLGPSRHQEGFGLPAAEAMASGLPTVLSEIPSFLSFDGARDYALFAPENDAAAMGEALVRLLGDLPLRRRIALRGREVAEQFRAHHTGLRLERYFLDRRTR
ncbi:MAG TPA: glycosyltransferase family 4 protein [Thermoanaerobaculia bacterium]|nr:glycosyltransferase family 4 protein [Thermoanaerobaculia bacterium]